MSRTYRKNDPGVGLVVGGCLAVIAFIVIVSVITGLIFTFLWNLVVPSVFGGPSIEWYQGIAILFLVQMLLGGVRTVVTK